MKNPVHDLGYLAKGYSDGLTAHLRSSAGLKMEGRMTLMLLHLPPTKEDDDNDDDDEAEEEEEEEEEEDDEVEEEEEEEDDDDDHDDDDNDDKLVALWARVLRKSGTLMRTSSSALTMKSAEGQRDVDHLRPVNAFRVMLS